MAANEEKRKFQRAELRASIMYAYKDKKFCFYGAKMHNFSPGGIYIESKYLLQEGMQITIRRANDTPSCQEEAPYRELMAEVKWCKEILHSGQPHYGAGAQYFNPVIELPF